MDDDARELVEELDAAHQDRAEDHALCAHHARLVRIRADVTMLT